MTPDLGALHQAKRKEAVRWKEGDRLPPFAAEAEAALLGAVLCAPERAAEVLDRLLERRVTPEWFYDLRHQKVWLAMAELHAKHDVPVDTVTLQQRLQDAGQLAELGGVGFLAKLPEAAPGWSTFAYYADIVRQKFILRRLIAVCTDLVGQAYEFHEPKIDPLLAEAEHQIESLSGQLMERRERHIKDVLQRDVIPQLEEHYTRGSQRLRGLSTHLTYLDKIVRGIRPNYYYVVAARPGDGKTSWAMNLVEATAAAGLPVGVFTLEMTDDSLTTRLLFSVSDVSSGNFEQGFATEKDFEKLILGASKLGAKNIYLDAEPDQTIEMIAAKARRMAKEYGIKLFVLDYLQLLDDDSEKYRNDRVQALRRISKKIVSLKNKLNIPWLVLAQMNRNIETSETKRPPVLSDLKECGAIEQDADVVMFLSRPLRIEKEFKDKELAQLERNGIKLNGQTVTTHDQAVEFVMLREQVEDKMDWPKCVNAIVAKNRYGPTGTAQLLFQKNRCRFLDLRDWFTAKGVLEYGKGERAAKNPQAELPDPPEMDEPL